MSGPAAVESTIHYQCFSGYEFGVIAGQEQRGACYVLGSAVLRPRLELVESLGGSSGISSIGQRRKNSAGTDRIDPDAIGGELERGRPREIDDRRFGR